MPFNKSFWISSVQRPGFIDEIIREAKEAQERELFIPKIEVSTEDFNGYINSFKYLPGPVLNPKAIIKLEKETNKMEAKKCDRCGKLYEKKFDKNDIQCVFKFEDVYITEEEKKKKYSKEIIEDKKTHPIYIRRIGDDIDLCPECRESFKKWFEG